MTVILESLAYFMWLPLCVGVVIAALVERYCE